MERCLLTTFFKTCRFAHTRLLFVLLLFSLACCRVAVVGQASPVSSTSLSPVPPVHIAQELNETFNVAIRVSEVQNLHSCELTITYNTSLLDVTQIVQGDFFPPDATFEFEKNESYGFVTVSIALSEFADPLDGDGTLTQITFEVAEAPTTFIGSVLKLDQIQLLNRYSESIDYKFVSAVLFWKSIEPALPEGERLIDLYTQKEGEGLGQSGGTFVYGDLVVLTSYVTYGGWPEQGKLVAFQVFDPLDQTVLIMINETNSEGYAEISFRIPQRTQSIGNWTAISTVDVACEVVWDVIEFTVGFPVGGSTFQIEGCTMPTPPTSYAVFIIAITICFIALRRSRKRAR